MKATHRQIVPTEAEECLMLATWLEMRKIDFLHIPNEGKRGKRTGGLLKAMGLKKGAPDYLIFTATPQLKALGHHSIAFEMKRTVGGRVTKEQKAWLEKLSQHGWFTAVPKGAHDAIHTLMELGY